MTRFLSLSRVGLLVVLLFVGIASSLHAQKITTFDPPNSTNTVPQAINVFGQVTGYYDNANGSHSFIRQRDGTFTTFNFQAGGFSFATFATDINPAGQVVGYLVEPPVTWSFLRQTDGTIVTFSSGNW